MWRPLTSRTCGEVEQALTLLSTYSTYTADSTGQLTRPSQLLATTRAIVSTDVFLSRATYFQELLWIRMEYTSFYETANVELAQS